MGMMSKAQLLAELTEHNEFFDMMVDMIPSKLYINPRKLEEEAGDLPNNNKFFRNQSKKTDTKEARRAAAKAAKRRKLDPEAVITTSKLQKKLEQGTSILPPPPPAVTPVASPQKPFSSANGTTTTTPTKTAAAASPHQSRIDALREKLHAKIAEKQQQNPRNNNNNKDDPNQVSKRAARRAEKERRREEAKKRKAAAPSSANGGESSNARYNNTTATQAMAEASRAADLAQLDFGRLAGLNDSLQKNYEQSNKALQNVSKSKNLHKMLADAEAKRQKLEELKQGDEDDQAKAQNLLWKDAFKEADGQRIKDDPAKLKKALKRKAAKKAKSQKAWQSRTAQVEKKQSERQKIRQHNLTARKQGGQAGANLSRKEIRNPEEDQGRRLSRAGFEGRKRDFINGGGDKKKTTKNQ